MKKKKVAKSQKKTKKNIPNNNLHGVDEQVFLAALDKISKKLIHKFKFGYHEAEDMKQQAAIFAIEGLKNYDHSRPLENFLWTHVRNRLFNYKRDNYQRPDKPCLTCPFYDKLCKSSTSSCTKYNEKNDCDLFAHWNNKNSAKKNIMKPLDIDIVKETSTKGDDPIGELIKKRELLDSIDKRIPVKFRQSYLTLLGGQKIPKKDYVALLECIKDILNAKEENDG